MKKRDLLIKYRGDRSQLDMANRYGTTQQTWSNWENGNSAPSPRVMKMIEYDSGYPMEQIFFDVFHK